MSGERLRDVFGGKYAIDGMIGRGGMGVVYAATHWLTRERVALKFLPEEDLHNAELKRRFIQEARAAADLHHPNVVRLLDLAEDDHRGLYMVFELLSGETLQQLLDRERQLSPRALATIVLPIMHATAAAHDAGIVHRDLKPANIFLHEDTAGRLVPKLLDFGIARVLQAKSGMHTRSGEVLGTLDYMSPEQAYGDKQLGPATDVWSMAVVMYRALAGVAPFARDNVVETMLDLASANYLPLDRCRPELPRAAALQAVIARALSREVHRRTPSMRALIEDFTRAVD